MNSEFEEKAEQNMQDEVTLDNLQLTRSKRFPGQNISVFDWTQNHSQEEADMFPIDVCLQKQTAKEADDIQKASIACSLVIFFSSLWVTFLAL